jgi:hypothetical protein
MAGAGPQAARPAPTRATSCSSWSPSALFAQHGTPTDTSVIAVSPGRATNAVAVAVVVAVTAAGLAGPAGPVEPVEQPHANIQSHSLRRVMPGSMPPARLGPGGVLHVDTAARSGAGCRRGGHRSRSLPVLPRVDRALRGPGYHRRAGRGLRGVLPPVDRHRGTRRRSDARPRLAGAVILSSVGTAPASAHATTRAEPRSCPALDGLPAQPPQRHRPRRADRLRPRGCGEREEHT